MITTFQEEKQLRITITLVAAGATFPGTGDNTLVLTGLRMSAVTEGVARYANRLNLAIYGMEKSDMDALTVLRFGPNATTLANNTILVEANDGTGWNQVFKGTIVNGSPQYNDAPNVSFQIQAVVGYYQGAGAVSALSYENGADASDVVKAIAAAMHMDFQNNGVSVQLPEGSYFRGSAWDQLIAVTEAGGFDYYIDNDTVVICPLYQPRIGVPTVELSPTNGLIGYPRVEVSGIAFDCYYTPAVALAGLVRISSSDVPAGNGLWMPYYVSHQLDALLPGGKWQSSINSIWQAAS